MISLRSILKRTFTFLLILQMCLCGITPVQAADLKNLPAPGQMIGLSQSFRPVMLEGLSFNPQKPFQFGFIVRPGDKNISYTQLRDESMGLVGYFLAALTIPQEDIWVNLSPYEKNRIIPKELSLTHLGGDLLAQDYILKQLSSSLVYPDGEVGREFWKKVHEKARQRFGSIDFKVDTFNKIWIMPEQAQVFVRNNTVVVTGSHLKVMMEEDYLAQKHQGKNPGTNGTNEVINLVMREVVLPVLEKEVNEGASFAPLRQILNAAILAEWYKRHLKESLVSRYYADRHKVNGINHVREAFKDQIYQQYVKAYKKGVYNFIREEKVEGSEESVPRKYFSGGLTVKITDLKEVYDPAQLSVRDRKGMEGSQAAHLLEVGLTPTGESFLTPDLAMTSKSLPGTVNNFIETTTNPYWTYTQGRLHEQIDFLKDKDPKLIDDLINHMVRVTGGWHEIDTVLLGKQTVFEMRVANNDTLGTPKGGIRYITVDDLMHMPDFPEKWKEFLELKPTVEQAKEFLGQWFTQEAKALATWGMTGKAAGLNLDLGGGKGLVFKGGVIAGADGQPQLQKWDDQGVSKEDRAKIDLYVAAHHARELALANAVGIDRDSPAPDKNTNPAILEKYNEIYLRVLTERGPSSFVWEGKQYDQLYLRLKAILDHIDDFKIEDNPLLEEAVRFSSENSGLPVPWIGVFTGKRYQKFIDPKDHSKGKVKMGGVLGRNEATGEGVVIVMKHLFDHIDKGYEGKTVAVQAFGNVGRYTAVAAAREGFKVTVINDYGLTLVKSHGWSEKELKDIIDALDALGEKGNLYQLLTVRPDLFGSLTEQYIVHDFGDQTQLQDVFKQIIGAKVDVLIPAFMEGQITKNNYHMVQAKWIVEGANGPTTAEAEELLSRSGKVVVPDTLANAGGVLCSGLEMIQALRGKEFTREEVMVVMKEILERAVVNVLEQRTTDQRLRPAFDRLGLLNVAKARMKKLIDANNGELNEIRRDLGLDNVFTVRDRIRKLELDEYWVEALKKKFNELSELIRAKLGRLEITFDSRILNTWLESIAHLGDPKAITAKVPDQGPLVLVRVLRRLLVEEETVEQTAERLHYTRERVIALRQLLSNNLKQNQSHPSFAEIYNYLTKKGLLPPADAAINHGGIDLDTSQMKISELGSQDNIQWVAPDMDSHQWQNIKGFEPVFINMRPVDIAALLSLNLS